MRVCRQVGAIASAQVSLARTTHCAGGPKKPPGAPLALALVLLTATGFPAQGSAEPERVRIEYSAAKGCPDRAAFIRALRQRTAGLQGSSGAERMRVFRVTITPGDSLVTGRLEIQGPGTESSLRSVAGRTCVEVVAALAFMVALAIDPKTPNAPDAPSVPSALPPGAEPSSLPAPGGPSPAAGTPAAPSNRAARSRASEASPPSPPATTAVPLAASSVPSSPAGEDDETPPGKDAESVENVPPPMALRSPTRPADVPAAARWRWSAGGQGGVSLGISPTMGFGGLLFVQAAAPGTAVMGPVLRAGLFLSQSDATLASGAGAEFWWATVLLEGCPVRLGAPASRLAFHGCLAFHLGVLRGQGRRLDRREETNDLWSDLGPVARIRVAVSARISLEAQGMLVLPLRRLTYDVYDAGPSQSPTQVFAVPRLGALAGIGLAYAFR